MVGAVFWQKKIFENLEGLKEDYYLSESEGQISPDLDFHQKSSLMYDAIDASNFGIFIDFLMQVLAKVPQIDNRKKYLVKRLPPNHTFKKNPNWGLKNLKLKKKITNQIKIIEKKQNLKIFLKK